MQIDISNNDLNFKLFFYLYCKIKNINVNVNCYYLQGEIKMVTRVESAYYHIKPKHTSRQTVWPHAREVANRENPLERQGDRDQHSFTQSGWNEFYQSLDPNAVKKQEKLDIAQKKLDNEVQEELTRRRNMVYHPQIVTGPANKKFANMQF